MNQSQPFCLMNANVRRLLILGMLALASLPVVFLVPHFQGIYAALEPYHVEGLWVCWLGAYVLANLCTPGFMQGSGDRRAYEQSGPRTIITLYFSVMGITWIALVVVFFMLWCIGWVWYFLSAFLYWLINGIVNWVVHLFVGVVYPWTRLS